MSARRAASARLIILGGDGTGLAVVRNAARHRLSAIVVARSGDISIGSRLARCHVLDSIDDQARLSILDEVQSGAERVPLIATNDRWLRFVIAHRAVIEQRFTVLHPGNDVLETCISKRRFALWAADHGIPSPELIDLASGSGLPYPLFLRPEWSNQIPGGRLPKAVPVAGPRELVSAIRTFEAEACPWVATRSLLGRIRNHYSIGVVVRGGESRAFVAEKIRPLPEQCAVGTYVILRHQPAAEALALTTLRALGFTYGIAEIEIAETRDGQLSVVEVNPRPWTQIELARRAGYDFLAFLLDLPTSSRPRPRHDGVGWIDFTSDLFACFSRSTGLVRHRRIGVGDYVRSLARARVFAGFAINDPYPALRELINVAATSLRHRI